MYQRPIKMSLEDKEKHSTKMSLIEDKHLNGYIKIYPDEVHLYLLTGRIKTIMNNLCHLNLKKEIV